MLKKILIITGSVIVTIVIVLCIICSNRKIKVGVVKSSYNNLSLHSENDGLSIPLYINQTESYITDIELINDVSLINNNDYLNCRVKDIKYIDSVIIDNTKYYLYLYELDIISAYDKEIILNDARLNISYSNGRSIDISVGNISLYKHDLLEDIPPLYISGYKGIVNEIDGKKRLVGIALKLFSSDKVKVKEVIPLSGDITINTYSEYNYEYIDNYNDINNYLYNPYKYNNITSPIFNFDLDGSKEIVLSIGYINDYPIYSFAFKIIYDYKGIEYILYTDRYCFYSTNYQQISTKDFKIYTYEYY